jgi:hypothetical protein
MSKKINCFPGLVWVKTNSQSKRLRLSKMSMLSTRLKKSRSMLLNLKSLRLKTRLSPLSR